MSQAYTRRDFLKLSAALMGSGLLANAETVFGQTAAYSPSTLANLQAETIRITPQDKVLVYIMLAGGNDSFNMLVPYSQVAYNEYRTTRSNLALAREQLLPLNGYSDAQSKQFALHPAMSSVQRLFHEKKLSFVANCGPLIEPTNKAAFLNNAAKLPLGLFSHSDQIRHWQTAQPNQRVNYGWLGRYADALQANSSGSQVPMNISLAGNNIVQNGLQSFSYGIDQSGSSGLLIKGNSEEVSDELHALNQVLLQGFNTMLTQQHSNPFRQTYVDMSRHAQSYHEQFQAAIATIQPQTQFSNSNLSQQLKMVARSIAASSQLGLPQQTFYLEYHGWDHHDELLNNHQRMLGVLSNALGEFDTALRELNLAHKVITFTGSDFGRTLTSNGNGTDHAWGGNTIVMGDAVGGGQVYGQYPSLALDSDLDIGEGVLIPTTSSDDLFAALSLWFGVHAEDLNKLFPNRANFSQRQQQRFQIA